MNEWIDSTECCKCTYLGEYDNKADNSKKYMVPMLMRFRKTDITLKRSNITYSINVTLTANRKKIQVTSSSSSTLGAMVQIVCEILRFENLFEGLFFPMTSFVADEENYTENLRSILLAYYNSQKSYLYIPIGFDNHRYKKLFTKWIRVEKKNKIVHPVFLYSVYLDGMPVDVRMALLLETFEPIAEDLHNRGIIALVKSPTKTFTNRCSRCHATISRTVPNKELEFKDKLKPIIKKYGNIIFKGDSKAKLISKAVKIRNKIDHVRANTENAMNGKQCGFYIYKFSLMYRYIMLQEIGMPVEELEPIMAQWVADFNGQHPQLRV